MYQYGNVAVKYRKEQKNRPNIYKQPKKVPQTQPKKQIRGQQSKKPLAKKNILAGEKILYILGVILIVGALFILLGGNASIAQMNYETQFLEREIVTLSERNDELRVEIAELSSPERILTIAREEWGLEVNESPVKVLSTSIESHTALANDTDSLETQELSDQRRAGRSGR
ncbi:cell division protein FtsL [Bacillus horti]|uniref:Cell division protein FtsL n=1 Tax=Caldalkalibacillus horti TaxID=77523 RepID=A0ABT9VUP4_9BACI|nr:cell division protein FtsL [Bacillus horti]MDQ0164600.1 cell division protein FtsL [Bacillus horti]